MKNRQWEKIAPYLCQKLKMTPSELELVADSQILLLVASGSSNESIAEFLDISKEEVIEVSTKYFGFAGWGINLDVNPVSIFNSIQDAYKYSAFIKEVMSLSDKYTLDDINAMFQVALSYDCIELRMETFWK